jgi:NAD(P)-dependent dehydrogenase (short-subunit alcohol dehydrogenase family)
MRPLQGSVAVVAGATRGAGRGIARALGEAGATVYCTGRSVRGNPSPYGRSETIDETAEMISAAGGTAIPVRVDHAVESEVRDLFARVDREQGRLDVVANSIAGEDPMLGGWTSLWDTDLSRAADALRQCVVSHLFTAKHAAVLMMRAKRGLIVEVTEFDLLFGGGNVLHDLVKSSLKALAVRMGEELRPHGVAALAVTPGYLRSESMLDRFGVTEATWRDGGKKDPNFLQSESPLFLGRAVAALAADPNVIVRSGMLTSSWELANDYGFTDAEGDRPNWGRHFAEQVVPALPWMRDGLHRHLEMLETLVARARRYTGSSGDAVAASAGARAPRRRGSRAKG